MAKRAPKNDPSAPAPSVPAVSALTIAAAALAAANAGFPAQVAAAAKAKQDPNRVSLSDRQNALFIFALHEDQWKNDPMAQDANGNFTNRRATFTRPEMYRYGLTVRDPYFVKYYNNQKTARGLTDLLEQTNYRTDPWFTEDMTRMPAPEAYSKRAGLVERKFTKLTCDTPASITKYGNVKSHTAPDGTIHYNTAHLYASLDTMFAKMGPDAARAYLARVLVTPETPADAPAGNEVDQTDDSED